MPVHTLSRRSLLSGGLASLICSTARAGEYTPDNVFDEQIVLGDTSFILRLTDNVKGFVYLNVHANEDTSVRAAEAVIKETGLGRLIEIIHTKQRNIKFLLGGVRYEFDPNRMFTPDGRRGTLVPYSKEADGLIAGLARSILYTIGMQKPYPEMIVALHNSTDGNYSIDSYAPDKPFRQSVLKMHKVPGKDEDDFFFVTESGHYEKIAAAGFNVVLQKKKSAEDDGSLSVFCGREGIPYINVEAQHGHVRQQIAMLKALNRLFGSTA
jgi:hypothetical protein